MKNFILKKIFLFVIIAGLSAFAYAAAPSAGDLDNIKFVPENPGANTTVSAQLISYTFDANRATIAWIIKGKVEGTGKNFSFTTGDIGSETILTVSVITADEKTLSKTFTFRAVEADLLWETSTYAPPQYKGKTLASPQSEIKVTAIPHGMKISDTKLIYEWKLNDKNIPASSGAGKNSLKFYMPETGAETVAVTVSMPDEKTKAVNYMIIKVNEPKILFYEEKPLEGPQYQKELGNAFDLLESELSLRAEPYFFSRKALPILSYEWRMNDKKIETPQKPNVFNLTAPSGQKGTSIINLALENLKNILERASKTIQINFSVQ
ncbi:MAG: hypothetical protein COY22_00310 [Candidatus Tagabacteria bacterium CG_4_10_14_0_2_um_filter_40_13]|nr:MAG: hypothetical protein COV90_00230 [Candidatus Tagabacteria bacterium CG11_big_fil_rev_8_21_14_0_20_41_11]PIZ56732.1 MAG: hypothetical protein COY22_00310 [Candidatus Tagabacteria bacterium CG_4_10_14_0_2_um_filter_40_13]